MPKVFGVRVVFCLAFVLVVLIVQMVTVSRLGQSSLENDNAMHLRLDEGLPVPVDNDLPVENLSEEGIADPDGRQLQETKEGADILPVPAKDIVQQVKEEPGPTSSPTPPPSVAPVFCEIQSSDAKSAISRASTEQCRNFIRNVSCLAQEGTLYNMDIPNTCPLGINPGVAVETLQLSTTNSVGGARILFLLSIHGRGSRQVRRLFKAIYHRDHYYYIHVDTRSDYLHREMKSLLRYPNVAMANWSLSTIWGGASLLQMLLRAMGDLERKPEWEWDFLINLSESDYPIQTNDKLASFLAANKGKTFVKTHGKDIKRFIQKQGLDRTFVECDDHMWRIGHRPLPEHVTIDGGSDWIVLSRRYADYLVTGDDELLTKLKRVFEFSLLPAESFFHTIIRNGHFCSTFVRNNLRITNWKRKLGCRCQYKHIVDWCGCSPNDFLARDIGWLKNPGSYNFMARKFEAIVNQEIITLLDAHLYGEFPSDTPGIHDYWESIYHVSDDITMPTDAHYTAYQSFLRIAVARLRNATNSCVPPTSIREVLVYRHADTFTGLVITMEAPGDSSGNLFEALFTPLDHMISLGRMQETNRKLLNIEVSSSWDEKESIFRNYAGILGPHDNPVLAMRWVPGPVVDVQIDWYDPVGDRAFTYRTKIEQSWVTSFNKPQLEKLLRPGKWIVKVLIEGRVTMETSFLVVPLTHQNKQVLDNPAVFNAARITDNHDSAISNDAFERWKAGIKSSGTLLFDWLDKLIRQFWSLNSVCYHGDCPTMKTCRLGSKWSTLSPDTKSELTDVNSNGRIR